MQVLRDHKEENLKMSESKSQLTAKDLDERVTKLHNELEDVYMKSRERVRVLSSMSLSSYTKLIDHYLKDVFGKDGRSLDGVNAIWKNVDEWLKILEWKTSKLKEKYFPYTTDLDLCDHIKEWGLVLASYKK